MATAYNTIVEVDNSSKSIIQKLGSDATSLKSECDQMYNNTDQSDSDSLKSSIVSLLNSLQISMSLFNSSVYQQLVNNLDQIALGLVEVPDMINKVNAAIVNYHNTSPDLDCCNKSRDSDNYQLCSNDFKQFSDQSPLQADFLCFLCCPYAPNPYFTA